MQNCSRPIRAASLLTLAAVLACTLGCGTTPKSTPAHTYAYVALASENYGEGCIAQVQVSSSGKLTPLSPAVVDANVGIFFGGTPLALDPTSQYLFAAGGDIAQFVIGPDGTISSNTTPSISAPVDSNSIAFSGSGFAIVTNGAVLNSYSMSSAGTLTAINNSPVTNANSMTVDPSGQFLYIVDEAYSSFAVYSISTNGALTLNGTIPSEYLPWSLVFSPNGMLYSVDYGAGTITEYSTDALTGIPTKVISFTTGAQAGESLPQGMAFNSAGAYAYVTNQSENTISQFAVDATTGALMRNGADVATGRAPSPIAVDPSGQFVFVGNLVDGTISQFSINKDGTLSPNGVVGGWTNPLNPNSLQFPAAIAFVQR